MKAMFCYHLMKSCSVFGFDGRKNQRPIENASAWNVGDPTPLSTFILNKFITVSTRNFADLIFDSKRRKRSE